MFGRALPGYGCTKPIFEMFDSAIKFDTCQYKLLRFVGQLRDNFRVGYRDIAEPLSSGFFDRRRVFGERALREEPRNDVHQPGGHFQRLTRKANPLQRRHLVAGFAAVQIKISARLIGKHHRLNVERIDELGGNSRGRVD